jgi:membrane dipeptidase
MLIIDGHLDLAWNALQGNRDLTCSAHTLRTQERMPGPGRGQGTVALPELQRGRVAICFATLFARCTGQSVPDVDYGSAMQAYGAAWGQLAYYRALEREGCIRIISDLAGLETHWADWKAWEAADEASTPPPVPGLVMSMECADPILRPDQVVEWWNAGVRLLGPGHYGYGRYTGGTGVEAGLTDLGHKLLPEMAQLGMVCDLTHLSDKSFWEVVHDYTGPLLASHSNCRALVPHQRQFSDEQIRAVFQRGGIVGVGFDAWMLRLGWMPDDRGARVTLADVVDHIDHMCQLAGNALHVGLGTDLDGGFGREQSPADLDTIADLPKLIGLLEQRGYGPEDIANLLHGNWLRRLQSAWATPNA